MPFLALQKIANHVVRREVTNQYLILDVEFIRPHMETISNRLLELMGTGVDEWKAVDRFNVEAALAGGLEHAVSMSDMTVDEVASYAGKPINIKTAFQDDLGELVKRGCVTARELAIANKSAINAMSGAKNELDQFAKFKMNASLLTGVSIIEEDPEEFYW